MRTAFVAVWYDTERVLAKARALGWKDGEDGLLDAYRPEEDLRGSDVREFPTLEAAVGFLSPMCADENKVFWPQGRVREFEVGGRPCRYCICRHARTGEPWRIVKEYTVEEEGIVEEHGRDDCSED
jgi:hypothetical protein